MKVDYKNLSITLALCILWGMIANALKLEWWWSISFGFVIGLIFPWFKKEE